VDEAGQLCILHSHDAEKNREEFDARVEKKKKAGDFDFRGTFFSEAVRFTGELWQANFSEARFQGAADFSQARFQGATGFSEATFLGEANFFKARFQGGASFSGATFLGEAYFYSATFQGAAIFWGARFQGEANFSWARFQAKALFESSRFESEARFIHTRFRKEISFKRSRFAGTVYLEHIDLWGTVEFEKAEFGSGVFFRGPFHVVPYAPLTDKEEGKKVLRAEARREPIPPELRFENVLLEEPEKARFEELDLRETTFGGTNVRPIEFRNVKWPQTVWFARLAASARMARWVGADRWERLVGFFGHNTAADEVRLTKAGGDEKQTERARRVCRDLKASLEDQRDYADAGDFYYAEMELRRRQVGPVRWLLYWVYWLVCGYGEKPLRALVFFLCLWLAVAGGFTKTWFKAAEAESPSWLTERYGGSTAFRPWLRDAAEYSLRSLVFQQRGGYMAPDSRWAYRLTVIWSLMGYTQVGLFLLAMRRRFRR